MFKIGFTKQWIISNITGEVIYWEEFNPLKKSVPKLDGQVRNPYKILFEFINYRQTVGGKRNE